MNKETFSWFIDRVYERNEEFRLFKSIVRNYVDDQTWQWICDEYNVELNNLRKERQEESV